MKPVTDKNTFQQFLKSMRYKYQSAKFNVFNHEVFNDHIVNENDIVSLREVCYSWNMLLTRRLSVWEDIGNVYTLVCSFEDNDNPLFNSSIFDVLLHAHEHKDLELEFLDKESLKTLWRLYDLLDEHIISLQRIVDEAEEIKAEYHFKCCLLNTEI